MEKYEYNALWASYCIHHEIDDPKEFLKSFGYENDIIGFLHDMRLYDDDYC